MRILARELDTGEQPTFFMGALGFSPEQRRRIQECLERAPDVPKWRLAHVRTADAWLVNGAKCRLSPHGSIRVAPGQPHERTQTLDVSECERPLAFSVPLLDPKIEPRCVFDLMEPSGLGRTLLDFEACLRVTHAQWLLGMHLLQIGAAGRQSVFHVISRDKLLAVFDFRRGHAGIAPDVRPLQVLQCEWIKRPDLACDLPRHFERTSPARLAWHYVRHSERDLLPSRYLKHTIYYRSSPRVPLSWLTDVHLELLRELATGPQSAAVLCERLRQRPAELARALACLYYAGSITTTPGKARPGATQHDTTSAGLEVYSSSLPDIIETRDIRIDATVPGRLERARELADAR